MLTFAIGNNKTTNTMNRFELTFEVRYMNITSSGHKLHCEKQVTTLGIFNTYNEACKAGNDFLDNTISKYYERNKNEKLGCFGGSQIDYVTNALQSNDNVYVVSIREIRFDNPIELIMDAKDATERVKEYKKKYSED